MLNLLQNINHFMWGSFLIFFLCGTGIFMTIRLGFIQIKGFWRGVKIIFSPTGLHGIAGEKRGITTFQALSTALASQIGTGNLAGAATAIMSGGPGAIFWMWVSAFFGMGTIFTEAILALKFRKEIDGKFIGGPAYYIRYGLKSPLLAIFFAVAIIIALGFVGVMVQANSICTAFSSVFQVSPYLVSLLIAVLVGAIIIGGIGRIGKTAEKIVPFMAISYLLGGGYVLCLHLPEVMGAFKMIFMGAFHPRAVAGGIFGVSVKEAMRYGVARGLFSNEAGMGSTPHAHAVAEVKHPVEQGLAAVVSVFIDTFVVLTMTALVILTTGVFKGGLTGIELTQSAFVVGMGPFGTIFVAVCLFFFAFTTIMGWSYFAEANVDYLFFARFGRKSIYIFRALVLVCIFIGAPLKVNVIWETADLFNGLMVIPNLIAVLALSGIAVKELKDYRKKKHL